MTENRQTLGVYELYRNQVEFMHVVELMGLAALNNSEQHRDTRSPLAGSPGLFSGPRTQQGCHAWGSVYLKLS